jgi:S-adenosyl methyltransferase
MLSRSIGTGEHPYKAQALPDACRFLLYKGWRSGMAGDGPESLGINPAVATAARMYDYWLGGHDHFAADRIAALEVEAIAPEAPVLARQNRAFLGRVVRYLAGQAKIGQFLDLGTGLPTRGNVHQVAQQANPAARVVYADNDPMVIAHSRALKTGPGVAVIGADLRDPDTILGHPDTVRLIDFAQPLAVLFVAVLHFVADADDPRAIVARYLDAAAPGSALVISHVTSDPGPRTAADVAGVYAATANPATPRPRGQILGFFDGLDLLPPGLVPASHWRPVEPRQADSATDWLLGAVARKPA